MDGRLEQKDDLHAMGTGADIDPIEVGIFAPGMQGTGELESGEVGYVATGLKTIREARVGDTLTLASGGSNEPLPGYQAAKPMVFAGLYPVEGEDYELLRDALEKLQLNDAALVYEPETSQALNYGFRCGFLGLFHMTIVQERLEREYDLDILATAPSVEYQVVLRDGEVVSIDSPAQLPDESIIEEVREPWMRIQIFTPTDYIGPIMDLVTKKRGEFLSTDYPDSKRVVLNYNIPLAELIVDFYDRLKSVTRGYASLDYTFEGYQAGDLVKLDVLVNQLPVDALALIVHRDSAYHKGQALVSKLKDLIPRQLFAVPIQAAVGKRVISRANVKALRKDVLSKCYGGDVSRKRKLLEKQKKGKKRLKMIGNVEVPQEAFMAVLRLDDD
jgi:GTP-binding protein LepA